MKNPFNTESPEWQLFENMSTNHTLSVTYAKEAEEKMQTSAKAKHKRDLYVTALEKLSDKDFSEYK